MDFDSRYRGEMIKYVSQRYGADHVAQIVTFSTIKARAAVRDAARVLDYPYLLGDKIAKLMPPLIMGRDTPLYACLEKNPKFEDGYKMAADLREFYESDPDGKRVIDVAKGLEGLRRQDGIHAAAVVITREPLTEYLPVQRKPEPGGTIEDAPVVTQYEMHGVEDLGLLKMDFLGLRNLDVIEITLDLVEQSTGIRPDIDNIPLDDQKTFDLLRAGDTIGVFQLEGGPMRALIRSVAPNSFEDVSAVIALYRPGPMAQNWHNEYADRKNGRKPITFPHPALEELLAPTYGLMVYQEQLMRLSQQLAGYSLEDAENLRKATGKKIRELIVKERSKFVDGCVAQGHERSFGEQMFDTIEPFADYSFNKSHTVGYGLVTFQTAYLKANHPHQYLAALLTSVKGDKDKSAIYLNECRQMEIPVLVPDVNESAMDFVVRRTVVGTDPEGAPIEVDAIRFGLSAVRNVGEGVVAKILEARDEGGPFKDFYDVCERVDPSALNKRTVESLIKAGAFDSLGHLRQGLFLVYEEIVDVILARRRERDAGVMSLFGDATSGTDDVAASFDRPPIPDQEFSKSQRLAFEKEMLGLYVSDHPLMGAERALRRYADTTLTELKEMREGEMRTVGGVVTALARKYTKRGDLMATFVLEDLGGAVEVMVFPKTMANFGELLAEDAIVCVKARIDIREDAPKLMAMEITRPELVLDGGQPVRIRAKLGALSEPKVTRLKELLLEHPGDSPVFVHIEGPEKTTVLRLGDDHLVTDRNGLFAEAPGVARAGLHRVEGSRLRACGTPFARTRGSQRALTQLARRSASRSGPGRPGARPGFCALSYSVRGLGLGPVSSRAAVVEKGRVVSQVEIVVSPMPLSANALRERRRLRAGHGGEVDGLGLEQQARPLGLRERGEVVQQPGQPQRLVVHRREVGRLVVEHAVLGGLHAREDAHHRRAQLVREVLHALLAQALLLLQRLGEAVERVGDGAHLVVAALGDAGVQVAGAHGLGAGADAAQRPRERHREVEADDHGDRGREHAGHEVHAQQFLAQLDLLGREQPAVVAAHGHGADLAVAHLDRRGGGGVLLRGSRGRVVQDALALGVVEVDGEELELGQVVQRLDGLLVPRAVARTPRPRRRRSARPSCAAAPWPSPRGATSGSRSSRRS